MRVDEVTEAPNGALDHQPLYHGTCKTANGEAILASGLILPGNDGSKKHFQAPVAGNVYLAKQVSYAAIYAVGADMLGAELPSSFIAKDGKYGYVFVVKTQKKLLPDEDFVGSIASDVMLNMASRASPRVCQAVSMALSTMNLPKNKAWSLKHGYATTQSHVGKRLLKLLPGWALNELANSEFMEGVSVAGAVEWEKAFRLNKQRCSELKRDGSNFFQIAELVGSVR